MAACCGATGVMLCSGDGKGPTQPQCLTSSPRFGEACSHQRPLRQPQQRSQPPQCVTALRHAATLNSASILNHRPLFGKLDDIFTSPGILFWSRGRPYRLSAQLSGVSLPDLWSNLCMLGLFRFFAVLCGPTSRLPTCSQRPDVQLIGQFAPRTDHYIVAPLLLQSR